LGGVFLSFSRADWVHAEIDMVEGEIAKRKSFGPRIILSSPLKLRIDVFHSQLGMQKLKSGWR